MWNGLSWLLQRCVVIDHDVSCSLRLDRRENSCNTECLNQQKAMLLIWMFIQYNPLLSLFKSGRLNHCINPLNPWSVYPMKFQLDLVESPASLRLSTTWFVRRFNDGAGSWTKVKVLPGPQGGERGDEATDVCGWMANWWLRRWNLEKWTNECLNC